MTSSEMVVVAIPDQVRWLSLRAVALSGVLEEPLVGGIGNILSQTIREYGLIRRAQAVPGTGTSEGPRE